MIDEIGDIEKYAKRKLIDIWEQYYICTYDREELKVNDNILNNQNPLLN